MTLASGETQQLLLEALIESVFDGVLIVSRDGRMLHHNQHFLDIWNFPPEVLESRSDGAALQWAASQTDNPREFLERVSSVYRNPDERVREEVRMKDGRVYERCGSAVHAGGADPLWMWTFRDITERKQVEEALRRSESRYRTLFDSLDEGFCVIEMVFDEAGQPSDYLFLEVNPAFDAQTGLRDSVGKRVREMVPRHEQFWFDMYGQIARTRQPVRFENHAAALGRWFDVYAFPVDAPELHRVGVLFTDTTQRKLASEALLASERFNRAVMEGSPDCIKVIDREGRVQFMNTGGQALMEIDDFAKFVGQPWLSLWGAENLPAVQAAIDEALQGRVARFQAMCPTAKGTVKWWDVMVAPIDVPAPGQRPERLISVSRDISEIKRAEEALRIAKEEAESASRAKDDFLAALSHELRTPLNPVLLTASALSADETLPAPIREEMRMIERNIGLEARLIDDLLDLTRISRGKLTISREPCDVHTLLGLVVEMVREEAREKQIDIHLDLAARCSGVTGDPARLQQVFWNLLRNAVKFSPPGVPVKVRSRDAIDDTHTPILRVEVADRGIGIAAESLHSIFEPFEQVSRERDQALGGLGLGLSIARSILELHDASLHAESPGPGRGATFIVELPSESFPAVRISSNTPHLPRTELPEEAPLHLLIVEDHEATLTVLARLLTKAGHTVVTATNVHDARAAAAAHRFDGVVSDVGLPDGTGFELMAELSSRYGLRGIVLSGYGMEDDLRQSQEVGFIAHLVKPVDIGELRRALRCFTTSG